MNIELSDTELSRVQSALSAYHSVLSEGLDHLMDGNQDRNAYYIQSHRDALKEVEDLKEKLNEHRA